MPSNEMHHFNQYLSSPKIAALQKQNNLQEVMLRAEETTQILRTLAALERTPGLLPSTHSRDSHL